MNNFSYYNPTKIIFGKGTISTIGKEINSAGLKKVLLIAGGGSIKKNGVYQQVINSLESQNIEIVEAWGVQANPTLGKVEEIIAIAKENSVDSLLAVGGGSVIDSTKAIASGYYVDDVWSLFTGKAKIKKALPIFTVLTLSATASEMNSGFVITNEKSSQKWACSSVFTFPKVSIIDPSVQISLPWNQTVNGAIDAIAHIMEFYFCGPTQETTLAIDESLMKTIITMTDRLHLKGDDYDARANLAWSATLALNGISGAGLDGGDWACHIIEHGLSALFPNIAHGAGLSVIFPAWVEYMSLNQPEKFQRWSKVWNEKSTTEALIKMRNKIRDWGNPVSLRDLSIKEEDLSKIADKIMEFPSIGGMSKLNREAIETILTFAY